MASCQTSPGEQKKLRLLLAKVRAGQRGEMAGLWGASAARVLAEWLKLHGPTVVVLAPDERAADALRFDLEFFLQARVPLYPAAVPHPLPDQEKKVILSERLGILLSLAEAKPPPCVVVPISSLLVPIPGPEHLHAGSITIETGTDLNLEGLKDRLLATGLRAASMVTAPGEFSIRGDIVDIYPMTRDRPLRLELFDEEVESIREIDVETQRSLAHLETVSVPLPGVDALREEALFPAHLADGHSLALYTPDRCRENLVRQAKALNSDRTQTDRIRDWMENQPGVTLRRILTGAEGSIEYQVSPALGEGRTLNDIGPSMKKLRRSVKRLNVLCHNEAEATRLKTVMAEQGVRLGASIRVVVGALSDGFLLPAWGEGFINHHELLLRQPVRRERKTRRIKARTLESFSELEEGDLVVHLVHGIARYTGIFRMERESSSGQEDFLRLEFKGETFLYLPASKLHLVEKYIGGGGLSPKLDRLGSKGFARRKEKVETAMRDLAADLLEVQAVREQDQGVAFEPDDELQQLFDASFPFRDTDDQVRAMGEIKDDMERRKPMDRLLCGDVGFGKTELAIRAAFKAVASGKQVAVLVPTTLLAQQHYETFRARLAGYPLTVEVLSRFKSKARQKEVVEAARDHRLDILIGTHRILSQDVGFDDLGLLVIDEEQRFGVIHKERLKKLKRTVDVLTLTATPIPRTLHMALVGLRDISSLEISPKGRTSIHTRVVHKSDGVIQQALNAECNRGGQSFYLHNRVETIQRETERVMRLVPKARVAYAHGQMGERNLEKVMGRFIRGEIDILVCTTIIESGIDLPRVNTILIDRADAFGLADLHQLRGRVGRAHVRAQAVLLIPKRPLSEVALRRLKAIEELSQLGVGFRLSLKDLEIRGAGNILGAEQHGHIAAVGYELFCRLLRQTILGMKGLPADDNLQEIDLDIRVDAYLPDAYIPDVGQRMEFLRRLTRARKAREIEAMAEALRDRFGPIPPATQNLLDICLVRNELVSCGFRRIATAVGRPYLVVSLTMNPAETRRDPFQPGELRIVERGKAHLYPPEGTDDPQRLLKFLKSRLQPQANPI